MKNKEGNDLNYPVRDASYTMESCWMYTAKITNKSAVGRAFLYITGAFLFHIFVSCLAESRSSPRTRVQHSINREDYEIASRIWVVLKRDLNETEVSLKKTYGRAFLNRRVFSWRPTYISVFISASDLIYLRNI